MIPTQVASMAGRTANSPLPDFNLFQKDSFLGLDRLLKWLARLNLPKTIIFSVLVTWVPLAILAAVQGLALGPARSQSLLLDPGMYARFFVALPVLFYSQKKAAVVLRSLVEHFFIAKLVKETEHDRFITNIASAMLSRRSRVMDWLLLFAAYAYSVFFVYEILPGMHEGWRTVAPETDFRLSLAGWWFAAVSQPLYLFVLAHFVYHIALWWRFLWQTSQLDLQLDASHPDRAAGLGFLGFSLGAFKLSAFAISASLAGGLADLVLTTGATVTSFKYEIVAAVLIIVGLFASPLLFFDRVLNRTRHRGVLEYWALWQRQFRQFGPKWLCSTENLDMLSVTDFSGATDLSAILERVQQTKLAAIRRRQIMPLLFASVFPFLLVLTLEVPLDVLLKELLRFIS